MTSTTEHVSVMRDRCVDLLSPAIAASSNPVVVDATLGLGGHTEAFLQKFPHLTVIGIDRDLDAIAKATTRLAPFGDRLKTAHSTFDGIAQVVANLGVKHIDGALFDLGVSSMQLDQQERGFSYAHDAPLICVWIARNHSPPARSSIPTSQANWFESFAHMVKKSLQHVSSNQL